MTWTAICPDLRDRKNLLLLLFVGALLVRMLYFLGFQQNPYFDLIYPSHDSMNVHEGAVLVSGGDLMMNRPGIRYPFYSYFVAAVYLISGNTVWAVWVTQFLLGAAASVLLCRAGTRLLGWPTGLLAGILYALYPQNLFYEGSMLRAAPTEFLAVLSCFLVARLQERRSPLDVCLAAVAVSGLIQCRANLVVAMPFVLACVWFAFADLPPRDRLRRVTLFVGVMIVTGLPLLARCSYVEKRFVFYDPSGPSVLLMSNLVDYDGRGWHSGSPRYRELLDAHYDKVWNSFPWVAGTLVREAWNHPFGFVGLYLRKARYFLDNAEVPDNNNFYLYQRFSLVLRNPLGNFSLIAALALAGAVATWKQRRQLLLVYLFLAGTTGSVLLFYNVSRLRMPAVPFFLLLAAAGACALYELARQRRFAELILTSLLVGSLAFALGLGTPPNIRANDLGMMASAFQRDGRYADAVAYCREALKLRPDHRQTRTLLARCCCLRGDFAAGIAEFRALERDDPNDGKTQHELALAYYSVGDFKSAQMHLDRASDLGVQVSPAFREAIIQGKPVKMPGEPPASTE